MENYSSSEMDRRESRRKRKQRNQMIAYAVLLIVVILAGILIVNGVRYLFTDRGEPGNKYESEQEAIDDLLAVEESIEAPEESTEVIPEPAPEEKLDAYIEGLIGEMPLEDKVAGLFFVTPEAITGVNTVTQAGEGTRTALEKYAVGGLIYFKKNIQSADQLSTMLSNTISYSRYPLFLGIDEEGGSVSRIASAGLAKNQPSAAEIGATGNSDNAYQTGSTIGAYLSAYGFNVNFAPVADLANIESSVMKDRSYASDAETAIPFVNAMMNGLQDNGVTACLKHFPGIGSTTSDTHNGLASISRSVEELQSQEFAVFEAGMEAGAQMIMVGHVGVPSLDADNTPASLSKIIVTDVLRKGLGYDGVIITDALNMSAISEYYSSEQAAVMALKAGCDMLLMPEDFLQAYAGVITAVADGTISEARIDDALKRIYRIKYEDMLEE